jgi:general secretion pathway protein G
MQLRQDNRRTRRAAFTLMEMLVVVAIIVALAGIGGFFIFRAYNDSQRDLARMQIKYIEDACDLYKIKHQNKLPADLDTLTRKSERGYGPWLEQKDLIDPWGTRYQYQQRTLQTGGIKAEVWTERDGIKITNIEENQ